MAIELKHLRAFQMVASELNFHRASQRLNIAQPALSRTIRDLEYHLKARLFERSTRVVRLTPVGRALLKEIENPIAQLEHAINRVKRIEAGLGGELRIGYNDFSINGLLPDIIRSFKERYPDIEVILLDRSTPMMEELVMDGELDIAFPMGPDKRKQLNSMVVRQERLICVLPEGHKLKDKETVSLTDLKGEPLVLGELNSWRVFHRLLHDFFNENQQDYHEFQHAAHSDGIMALVAAGIGVTLHPDAEWLHNRRGLIVRPLAEGSPEFNTQAIWKSETAHLYPVVGRFIDECKLAVERYGLVYNHNF